MKQRIIGAILGAATVAGVLTAAAGAASATDTQQDPEVCFTQVPVTQYRYTRTTETTEYEYAREVEQFKTEFRYAKYTQTRCRGQGCQ